MVIFYACLVYADNILLLTHTVHTFNADGASHNYVIKLLRTLILN